MSEPVTTELDSFLFLFPNKTAEEFEAWKNDPANETDYNTVKEITAGSNASEQQESPTP